MNLPKDPKALEIIEKGKEVAKILGRNESLHTGEFRRDLDDWARYAKWAENRAEGRV